MTWISKSVTGLGFVLLAHAWVARGRRPVNPLTWYSCYSANEHSTLHAAAIASHGASASTVASLPLDISIETIVAIFAVCLGLVLGTPELRPIEWRVWAGKIEREGEKGFMNGSGEVDKDFIGNPFRFLESRPGFADIRKQRKDFAEWVREGGSSDAAPKN